MGTRGRVVKTQIFYQDKENYLKSGISDNFLSSKVALSRLDCIGSCGAKAKNQQIFLRTYI